MGQRSTGARLERDSDPTTSFLLFETRNDRTAAFRQRKKKVIHSPMFNHHSIIPLGSFRGRQEVKWGSFRDQFGDHFRVGDHFGVGIISGAVQSSAGKRGVKKKINIREFKQLSTATSSTAAGSKKATK